jgi:hypothetical protein
MVPADSTLAESAGRGLLASALISWLFVLPQHIRGHADNSYIGIVVFLVLPATVAKHFLASG